MTRTVHCHHERGEGSFHTEPLPSFNNLFTIDVHALRNDSGSCMSKSDRGDHRNLAQHE